MAESDRISVRARLIINADDLGYASERDDGILACHAAGGVTSASLLVNGASARSALARAVQAGLPVGLHVNLTEGAPVSAATAVRSLLAPPGCTRFRGKHGLREALARGEVLLDEVATEARAQLSRFWALHPRGGAPSHYDGHQHVHVLPGILEVLVEVLGGDAGGVRACRLPASREAELLGLPAERAAFYAGIGVQSREAAALLARKGFVTPVAFLGYSTLGADASVARGLAAVEEAVAEVERMESASSSAAPPVIEWMVHPGYRTRPRPHLGDAAQAEGEEGAGCGDGPDDFAQDAGREQEMRMLCDPALLEGLRVAGVVLVAY